MTQETIAALVPVILTLVIGLVLGGLIGAVIASSMQKPSQPTNIPPNRNLRHVVGLWRDKRSGRLAVEMEEKYFASVEKLPSRQVSLLIQSFNDLQIWLNVDNIASRLGMTRTAEASGDKSSQIPLEPVLIEDQSPAAFETDFVEPVRVDVNEIVTRAVNPKGKITEKPKSIVEQVDEIVQKRLSNSAYKDRLIRLVDAPGGGVEVLVDAKKYEGVGDVPDPEVRNFIQECVKEWEKGR
jgi:hypothetical protein